MLYQQEAPGSYLCSQCMTARGGIYKCRDCFGDRLLCKACIVEAHEQMPFHHPEEWFNDSYFKRVTFDSLGLSLHCGHGGKPCPEAPQSPNRMQIVDKNGAFTYDVYPCGCTDAEFWEQLFAIKLFPQTYELPQTAFTFAVFKDFQILNFAAKTCLWEYWGSIQRRTDGVQWKRVKVRGWATFTCRSRLTITTTTEPLQAVPEYRPAVAISSISQANGEAEPSPAETRGAYRSLPDLSTAWRQHTRKVEGRSRGVSLEFLIPAVA